MTSDFEAVSDFLCYERRLADTLTSFTGSWFLVLCDAVTEKVNVAHTRLPSVGFRS